MANNASPETILRMDRTFDAPVDLVFRAFTEPDQIAQWWGPEGFHVPEHDISVEVGGSFRTCMRGPDGDHWVRGEYSELVPNKRLAFSWAWETDGEPGPATYVTIDFEATGDQTVIHLTHEGFDGADSRDAHGEGWTSSLTCLDELLEKLKSN